MADTQTQTKTQAPRATTLLVDWREPRLLRHVASPKPVQKDADGKELPPDPRASLVLKPGINSVDTETWEHAAKSILFKHYIEDEKLVVIETREGKTVSASELDKLTESEAKKVVKSTNTEDLLEGWQKTEKRAPVKVAIEDQLDAIAKAAAPVEKKDSKKK